MRTGSSGRYLLAKALLVVVLCLAGGSVAGQEARKALSKPAPEYPEMAKRLRLSGKVKVEIVIGANGQIKDTKVIGGHPILVDAALVALRKWKYAPASSETTQLVEFDFHP